jgi:hypothetical protein
MLGSLDALLKGYLDTIEQSKKKCPDEIEEIRKFIIEINWPFFQSYQELLKDATLSEKILNSLVDKCYMESFRISGHILFFSVAGLYRNAFDSIRYVLESVVQALYLDIRHPNAKIGTKVVILEEVEDKIEYHAIRLIGDLDIDFKDKLQQEYKKLSRIVHPSHKQITATMTDMKKAHVFYVVPIDCEEISNIYNSVKMMVDIFFYLVATYLPEIKVILRKNSELINSIKTYRLPLLAKIVDVRL